MDHSLRYPKNFDVNIRLSDVYCFYDDKPFYCSGPYYNDDDEDGPSKVSAGGLILDKIVHNGIDYPSLDTQNIEIDPNKVENGVELLDAHPFKLGWVSTIYRKDSQYIMRQPMRSQRAGMSRNNCASFSPFNAHGMTSNLFSDQASMFASMVDLYERDWVKNVEALMNNSKTVVAFSHDIAVAGMKGKKPKFGRIFFRYLPVGLVEFGENKVFLSKNLTPKVKSKVGDFLDTNDVKIVSFSNIKTESGLE